MFPLAFTLDRLVTQEAYSWMYLLSFAVGMGLFLAEGFRRKMPLGTWTLLGASATFMVIVGTRLGTFSWYEWWQWWTEGTLIHPGRKTAVGGLILGFLGLWAVRYGLRFRGPLWDAFAYYLPATLLIQRAGCLAAGCCLGTPTGRPWGLAYTGPGWLRDLHVQAGYLPADAAASLPVHPVPLYEMATSLLILLSLLALRHRLRRPGQAILFSVSALVLARFVLEFFREAAGNFSMATPYLGLKTVQWIMLAILALTLTGFLRTLRRPQPETGPLTPQTPKYRHWILLLAMGLLLMAGHAFFAEVEKVVLLSHLLLAGIALVYDGYHATDKRGLEPVWRMVLPVLLIVLLTSMALEDPPARRKQDGQTTILSAHVGHMDLNEIRYPCLMTSQGCFGPYCAQEDYTKPHGPGYSYYQVGIEHHIHHYRYPISIVLGLNTQFERYHNHQAKYFPVYYSLAPYIGLEGEQIIGGRIGFRMGDFYADGNLSRKAPVQLTSRLWVGYRPWFVLQFSLRDHVVPGPGVSSFAAHLDLNAGLLSRDYLGRFRVGAIQTFMDRTALHSDLELKWGNSLTLVPSLTLLPGWRGAPTNWGPGLGARWAW